MKRGFATTWTSRALVFCSILLFAATAGAQSYTVRVLNIDTPSWRSHLLATSEGGATLRTTNCSGFAAATRTLPIRGSLLVENFSVQLCAPSTIGVSELTVQSGDAAMRTVAIYNDALGNFNVVEIPSLPSALTPSNALAFSTYDFRAIENSGERVTFIAFITTDRTGTANLALTIFDENDVPFANENVSVRGFGWYELKTGVRLGNLRVSNVEQMIGPRPPSTSVYAVAFVGYRKGGSPRVVVPDLFTSF